MRVDAIDAGALASAEGTGVRVRGHVTGVPRREDGEVRVRVETADGRLLVEAPEPVPDLPVGAGVDAVGTLREPGEWERAHLARQGIRAVLAGERIELTGSRRGGLAGALDSVRSRAEVALGRGTSAAAADLLRGFVLGQDDRIDPDTVEEFKRSGLAHLLAVSGQNVLLLAVLVAAVLAALAVPIRSRLLWILLAIAIYVPVAGAGPSIQRAGIAGAAGVVAALASRPSSRWYALLLAAAGTLALNPRTTGDVGWQLSFAAVLGILVLTDRLRGLLPAGSGALRTALVDGIAVTLAATAATAPLMAHHFGTASLVALPANVLVLPSVAPVMWLGMLVAALGQIPWVPVEPLVWVAGALAGFVAQVAAWFAAPSWAQVDAPVPGVIPVAALLLGLGAGLALLSRWRQRRSALLPRTGGASSRVGLALALAALALAAVLLPTFPPSPTARPEGMRIRFLDVGQGDAILVEPGSRPAILIDAGPAEADVAGALAEAGVERLGALVVTHPQADHAGGVPAILARLEVERLLFGRLDRPMLAAARAAGVQTARVEAGDRLRAGRLRLDVLWPSAARLASARTAGAPSAGDPNETSLVLRARWGGFEALLTGDAEAELAPVHAGTVDLLKVAHHGSQDSGLAGLLAEARPSVAVISVGSANPYGHPAAATLATLEHADLRILRTDEDGEVVVEVGDRGWRVR